MTKSQVAQALLSDAERFPFSTDDLRILSDDGIELVEISGHDPASVVAAARNVDALFVYSLKIDKGFVEQLDNCKVIARCGTGYDNIDVSAARANGIEVTYVPEYGAEDVAEHTIALLFASARRLAASDRAVQGGAWPSYLELGPMRRISGANLGLIGLGRIARQVAIRAGALGLNILAYDPFVDPDEAKEHNISLRSFEDVLGHCDYVSIHLPLTPDTKHLIDEAALSHMRPYTWLINTSRGAIVDQEALLRALDSEMIAGAALDVLEREPPTIDDALLGRANVVITPHTAAYTDEALSEVRRVALLDVVRVLNGQPALHPVPAKLTIVP